MADATKRIVYSGDDGRAIIIVPAPNCPLTIEEIAQKDVPEGKAYQIIDAADLPEDRTFRDAWELDI